MKGKFKNSLKSKLNISKLSVLVYWLIFLLLACLFFTNDFGLVDIHKTSIITAVAIDTEEGEVLVTAEIAVPQPSQSGENIVYTQVQGSGLTIADALNEINAKSDVFTVKIIPSSQRSSPCARATPTICSLKNPTFRT